MAAAAPAKRRRARTAPKGQGKPRGRRKTAEVTPGGAQPRIEPDLGGQVVETVESPESVPVQAPPGVAAGLFGGQQAPEERAA